MEITKDFFAESKKAIQEYLENRILLLKLKATEKVSKAWASVVIGVLAMMLVFVFLILLCILGGFFFASLTGSTVGGFAIITGIYLVIILVVLFILKKWVESCIVNQVIRRFFSQNKVKTKIVNNG